MVLFMTTQAELPKVEFIDNPNAPDVFAAEAFGFFINAGNIHITFTTLRVNHSTSPGPVSRVVIGRLVMPIGGAQALASGLYDFLKRSGLDPVPTPDKDKSH
jgi:hypothetical protein